jgi:hypothetical protein
MRAWLVVTVFFCSACTVHRVSVAMPGSSDNQTRGWVDLSPGMELGVEAAYYREGVPRTGLSGYLGAESVNYEVSRSGTLRLTPARSFVDAKAGKTQPRDQPAVETLVKPGSRSDRYHRLFFQVVMSRNDNTKPAVLLSARSGSELERVTRQFAANQFSSCTGMRSDQCVAFPELCTASLQIGVGINGVARKVGWGSSVSSVTAGARKVELFHDSHGQVTSVSLDVADVAAMRTRLAQGDRVSWE